MDEKFVMTLPNYDKYNYILLEEGNGGEPTNIALIKTTQWYLDSE